MYPKFYNEVFRSFDRLPEIFVGMPFSKTFEPRWTGIIKPAIRSFDLKPHRVKERVVSDSIPVDILRGIARAKYLLFDISNDKTQCPNPNVMYELGIAHATRLPEEVLIIRDQESQSQQIPFDIKHIRWNTFPPGNPKKSVSIIKGLIRNARKQIDVTKDQIVTKVLSALDPDMLSFLQTIRPWQDRGFDLHPFDPDRKGLYSLPHKDCSEDYLRLIARELISAGVLEARSPVAPQDRIYGGSPEYYVTQLGRALQRQMRS